MSEDLPQDRDQRDLAVGTALGLVLGHAFAQVSPLRPGPNTMCLARQLLDELRNRGYAVIPDQPDHYVTFDADGWFIEHSVACRIAGTIGTCEFNQAIRDAYDEPPPPEDFGRWCITGIDDEGMPSLRRVSG